MKAICSLIVMIFVSASFAADLEDAARRSAGVHRFSTVFPAQNVRDELGTDAGIDAAIEWCKGTGITKCS